MSSKRRADKELTSDNWDEEDEPEEKGTFRVASQEILQNRVIKTAKRRITNGANDSERPSIFSGFTGFGTKTDEKKSSFSFVSDNLKGVDTVNTVKNPSPKPTFPFSAGSSSAKPAFSLSSSTSSSRSNDSAKPTPSLSFKCDTADNSSKLNTLSSKLETVASEEKIVQKQVTETKKDNVDTPDEIFQKKLRSLNLLCAEWIIKHLNENLSYILTPIFDDYKKHLTQLKEERRLASSTSKKARMESTEVKVTSKAEPTKSTSKAESTKSQSVSETSSRELFSKINSDAGFLSGKEKEIAASKSFSMSNKEETTGFKFFSQDKKNENVKTSDSTDSKQTEGLFKFSASSDSSSLTNPTNGSTEPLPPSFFSFKPTTNSFFSHSTPKMEAVTENDDDGPPPMEDVTIKEEGSVYDKKCKIFIKKDGNFIDHGVGFLFLKQVGDEKKCQVIVRANNKLANIIINVLLSASVPIQKMGKNNVMVVCCPTPETKQPTSVLIKVKTSDDAEELLNQLNKYRK